MCSSAAAPTADSRTCAMPRGYCADTSSRKGVKMLVVPGSQTVKRAAEAEGLDRVFLDAGAEWRESGCSMCLGMNGDLVPTGQYSISTSNRNFEGRQGSRCAHPARESRNRRRLRDSRTRHRSARIHQLKMPAVTTRFAPAPSSLPATNIDTDQIIPGAVSDRDFEGRFRQTPVRRLALRRRRQSEAGLRAQQARSAGRRDPRRRPQHRLRLVA